MDSAGIDILLVGDSVGMVVHGHDTTLPVTVEARMSTWTRACAHSGRGGLVAMSAVDGFGLGV